MDYLNQSDLSVNYDVATPMTLVGQKKSQTLQASAAEAELERIYSMRTWRLIQKYQNFINNTRQGQFIRKILRL